MAILLYLVDHASQESNEASPSMESTSLRSAENTPRDGVAKLLPLVAALLQRTPLVLMVNNGTCDRAPVESVTTIHRSSCPSELKQQWQKPVKHDTSYLTVQSPFDLFFRCDIAWLQVDGSHCSMYYVNESLNSGIIFWHNTA